MLWTRRLRVGCKVACAVSHVRGADMENDRVERTANLGGMEKVVDEEDGCYRLWRDGGKQT